VFSSGFRVLVGIVLLVTLAVPVAAQRRQPPGARPPESPDLSAFLECYRADKQPEIAVFAMIAAPSASISDADLFFREAFEAELRRFFSTNTVRLAAGGRDARQMDAQVERLLAERRSAAAADLLGRRLNCSRVFFVTLRPAGRNAAGATTFNATYDIVDITNDRFIATRAFPRPVPADTQERRLAQLSSGVAREMIKDYVANHCGIAAAPAGRSPTPAPSTSSPAATRPMPGIEGPVEEAFLGVPVEMTVRFAGDLGRRDPLKIAEEITQFEYIESTIGSPRVVNTDDESFVELTIRAFGDPFRVGEDVGYGVFLATGKDSVTRTADDSGVLVEVLDPTYTFWVDEDDERNASARLALRNAYQSQGSPTIAVVTREVVGQDRNEETVLAGRWFWYHTFRRDLWTDNGDIRQFSGEAVANSVKRYLQRVGLDTADAVAEYQNLAEAELPETELRRASTLDTTLRDGGFELIADGKGELSRRDDMVSISYNFNIRSLAARRDLASSLTASRVVPFGDLAAGGFTNEIARELSGQLIESLYQQWSDGVETTSILLPDADTVRESDVIRAYLEESVPGVSFTTFRGVGSQGQLIEVSHRGAGDAIRQALTTGDAGIRFELTEGSTPNRLVAVLAP
jgi:hypothetical protein